MPIIPQAVNGTPLISRLRFATYLGAGNTGLAPTIAILRVADGMWWSGAAWAGAPVAIPMPEIDAVNMPGLYTYAIAPAGLDPALSDQGYRYVVLEGTLPYDEASFAYAFIPSSVLQEPIIDNVSAGNLADFLNRTLGTRHGNTRIIYTTFNSNDQPTTGAVLVYPDSTNLLADSDPWPLAIARYDFTLAYDASNRVTEYVSQQTI